MSSPPTTPLRSIPPFRSTLFSASPLLSISLLSGEIFAVDLFSVQPKKQNQFVNISACGTIGTIADGRAWGNKRMDLILISTEPNGIRMKSDIFQLFVECTRLWSKGLKSVGFDSRATDGRLGLGRASRRKCSSQEKCQRAVCFKALKGPHFRVAWFHWGGSALWVKWSHCKSIRISIDSRPFSIRIACLVIRE
jgi:hypothetical protein